MVKTRYFIALIIRIVQLDGKSIGIFNVNGRYHALLNRCPHNAGTLCEGPITGTTLPTDKISSERGGLVDGRSGELIRCGWHGWEFEIATGQCLVNSCLKARTYAVTVEDGQLIVHI
jgi:nitrite reductase/ring-hydroxylating ferredoxin subunit